MKRKQNAGFTMIEVCIALTIMVLIIMNVHMIMRTSANAYKAGAVISSLESQADQTMHRIAMAVMSSSSQEITPSASAPLFTSRIDYTVNLGMEGGDLIWGDPERIELQQASGQIVWSENPDQQEERSVVWSSWASGFLEGEVPNGEDDNRNEITDEEGLTFTKEGDMVKILLTLERTDGQGEHNLKTNERHATCRN